MTAGLLCLALLLDAILGEPDWLWRRIPHPAVLMGRAVGWCEARLNTGAHRRSETGPSAKIGYKAASAPRP